MAVNDYDPIDGHPFFLDTDAPDIKVDPTKVSEYAARVGTRLIGTDAEMTAYGFAREGLRWKNTTDDTEYEHDGTNWVPLLTPIVSAGITLSTGWTATTGTQHTPRLVRVGSMVHLVGSVTAGGGFSHSSILTVPVAFRPSDGATRFVGCATTSAGAAVEYVLTAGVLSVPAGYATGIPGSGSAHPLHCMWVLD